MRRLACTLSLAAMIGAIDLARGEEAAQPPRRRTASLAAAAEAYATIPGPEERIESRPCLDGDRRRALLEMARGQDADQIPTLLKAARYLDDAGLPAEAVKVRSLAARRCAEWQALLDEKSAELIELQADVDALRKALGDGPQVQIDFRILAVSLTHVRQMGLDWANVTGNSDENRDEQDEGGRSGGAPCVIDASSPFFRILDLLGSRHVTRLLAEPCITTVSGREAFFQIGKDSAPGDDAQPARLFTRAEILPTVAGDGRIHLKLKFRVGPASGDRVGDDDAASTREAQVAAWLRPGQTLFAETVIAHRLVDAADSPAALEVKNPVEEIEYVILATPKLVDDSVAGAPKGPGPRR